MISPLKALIRHMYNFVLILAINADRCFLSERKITIIPSSPDFLIITIESQGWKESWRFSVIYYHIHIPYGYAPKFKSKYLCMIGICTLTDTNPESHPSVSFSIRMSIIM